MSAQSAAQLDLGTWEAPSSPSPHRLAFLIFHSAHPDVLERLARLARADVATQVALGIKRPRVSIKGIWEQLRAELRGVHLVGAVGVKLNNNHTAWYARLLAEEHADLASVFRTRDAS